MSEKKKVTIVNLITGSRILGAFTLPFIASLLGPLGTALYMGGLWITDAIDGYLAKHKWDVSTIFGANLDAFSDKLLGISTLIYLYKFYPIVLMPLAFEFAIFGVNWHFGKKGADVKSSKLGKRKTIIFDIVTAFSILSTLSLTNVLSSAVTPLMTFVSGLQAVTLKDYIKTHENYLKAHTPTKDVTHMGFFETIKTIIKKLRDKKLYSPEYYKKHKNEALLDILLKEETADKELKENKNMKQKQELDDEDNKVLSIEEENELKINYNLSNKELDKIKEIMKKHNLSKEEINNYLELYLETINTNYRNEEKIEQFLNKQEKINILKK